MKDSDIAIAKQVFNSVSCEVQGKIVNKPLATPNMPLQQIANLSIDLINRVNPTLTNIQAPDVSTDPLYAKLASNSAIIQHKNPLRIGVVLVVLLAYLRSSEENVFRNTMIALMIYVILMALLMSFYFAKKTFVDVADFDSGLVEKGINYSDTAGQKRNHFTQIIRQEDRGVGMLREAAMDFDAMCLARVAKQFDVYDCVSISGLMLLGLFEEKFDSSIERFSMPIGQSHVLSHSFLVLGRDASTNSGDLNAWNPDAYVLCPWYEVMVSVADIRKIGVDQFLKQYPLLSPADKVPYHQFKSAADPVISSVQHYLEKFESFTGQSSVAGPGMRP